VTAVSFTTIAQPNPGGVLLVEIPAKRLSKVVALVRAKARAVSTK
jgi:hypothetical protein